MTVLDVLRYSPLPDIFNQDEIGKLPDYILQPWALKCANSIGYPLIFPLNYSLIAAYVHDMAIHHSSALLFGRTNHLRNKEEGSIVNLVKVQFTSYLRQVIAEYE